MFLIKFINWDPPLEYFVLFAGDFYAGAFYTADFYGVDFYAGDNLHILPLNVRRKTMYYNQQLQLAVFSIIVEGVNYRRNEGSKR